jgi:hypothetical protein
MFIIPCYLSLNALISSTYNLVLFYISECLVNSSIILSTLFFLIFLISLFFPSVFTPHSYTSFIHLSMVLQPFVWPWPLLQFRNLFYTAGRTSWTSDQPVARQLPTHRRTQTQNKRTHRHPWLQWDSQRSSERRVHALDRAATVINLYIHVQLVTLKF